MKKMKRFTMAKVIISMALLITMMLGGTVKVWAASAEAHEHSYGSYEYVERVIFTDNVVSLFTYERDGHTYEVQRVTEWCLFYRECYCGARGCYREGGRTYDREVLIS